MPYNTRRKSLSLPSLGIHVPGSHSTTRGPAASAMSRSIPEHTSSRITIAATTTISYPNKRQKRSHEEATRHRGASLKRPDDLAMIEHTPPPSPTADNSVEMVDSGGKPVPSRTIDLEGINDEIVQAVIAQLLATANRPHLVKELATVLSQQLTIVQHSSNPCAIISSRLAAYLKRSYWSTLSPCPLAKELETVHPRRTYFYLTTCSRQAFPDSVAAHILQRSVISPSLSSVASGSDDGDDMDLRRRELSQSPEVDLSSPEFDDADDDFAMPATPVGSLPNSLRYARSHRSASPPLEKDEREFTQTADGLQKRKLARELSSTGISEHSAVNTYEPARDDTMFDDKQGVTVVNGGTVPVHFITSPAIKATLPSSAKKDADGDSWLKLGTLLEWDHSPENIELDELDCLLDSC